MSEQIIQIFRDANGNVTLHAKGIKGDACETIIDELLELFHGETDKKVTDEYFEGGDGAEGQAVKW